VVADVELVLEAVVKVGSLHLPNHPGCPQEIDDGGEETGEVGVEEVVMVGPGTALPAVVVSSLQPNQPGVLQVAVVVSLVDVEGEVLVVVVLSSKHPHQPGVLQVLVRVRVVDTVLDVEVEDSELLLLGNFQFVQS
jgi:hypothetical protein